MKHFDYVRVSQDFTAYTYTLIPIGIVLNLAIGQLVSILKIPIFLDSVGTVLVAVLCGPIPGVLTGVLSGIVGAFATNPILPWYSGTAAVIGLFAAYWASNGYFKKWWTVVIGGILMGVIAAVVSSPVTAYIFGGITLSGSSLIVAYLMQTGRNIIQSVILAGIASDPVDKMLTFLAVWFLLKSSPIELLRRFPRSLNITD